MQSRRLEIHPGRTCPVSQQSATEVIRHVYCFVDFWLAAEGTPRSSEQTGADKRRHDPPRAGDQPGRPKDSNRLRVCRVPFCGHSQVRRGAEIVRRYEHCGDEESCTAVPQDVETGGQFRLSVLYWRKKLGLVLSLEFRQVHQNW